MKFRKNRKGFTIVELIIVIAVIGVLTAVLVPTIVHLVNKANKASDQSLVSNLNKSLAMREAETGEKCKTMQEAVESLEPYGYKLEALVTKGDQDLLFNLKENKFYLKGEESGSASELWRIQNDANDQTYNIYAGSQFTSKEVAELTVGFDAGYHDDFTSIEYKRPNDAAAKSVVFNTMGDNCVFTVNSIKDHVEHYGYAEVTNVVAVNSENSYHEYGGSKNLVVTAGKVVIEQSGVVMNLSATDGATATVSNNGGNVMESSVQGVEGTHSLEISSLAQLEAFRDMSNSGVTFEGKTINLNADITLNKAWKPISNYSRNTEDATKAKWFEGTFDGKGHTISGLTNVGLGESALNRGVNATTIDAKKPEVTYGLFGSVKNALIKNLNLRQVNIKPEENVHLALDVVGGLFGYMSDAALRENEANIHDINVAGSISGSDNIGAVFGRVKGIAFKAYEVTVEAGTTVVADKKAQGVGQCAKGDLILDTVVSHANVTSNDTKQELYACVAGLAVLSSVGNCHKVTMTSCSFDGTLTTVTDAYKSNFCIDSSGVATKPNSNGVWNYTTANGWKLAN